MNKLEVRDLVKSFEQTRAVDGISFTASSGLIYGLVGRNGAGKTTTIRLIMDIYRPDSGDILFNGQQRGPDFHRHVGYLPEERGLYKFRSVLDNLLFLAEIKGVKPAVARPKALEYLERFELGKYAKTQLDKLSKGNQQKVQFLGTILHDPQLVILDEPFSGLDPVNVNMLTEMFAELKNAGKLLILSTHVMEVAEKMCDSVALIDKGRLVLNAPPAEIKARYAERKINLEIEGDVSFLSELPYVTGVQRAGAMTTVQVSHDNEVQELLRALVIQNVVVMKFQANDISLHDVFVNLTGNAELPPEAWNVKETQSEVVS
jgi:ABC-2 type transport system ATP-binding protein